MIRFGIVGTNTITEKFLKGAFLDPRFSLSAVYSRQEERARAFAARYGAPHVFTSLHAMAASPHVDAVYIASPNALHAPQSVLFMRRGKHVLCEKAFASNAREVREMIDCARTHGVLLMEAMKPTLQPNFRVVCENLPRIGKIRRYFSSYCSYSSRYDHLKAGIVENAFKPELSNGALMDIGVYCIFPMVVLFGTPRQVIASSYPLYTGVDGQGAAIFRYDDMDGLISYAKTAPSSLPTEILGEEGSILIERIGLMQSVKLIPRNGTPEDLTIPPIEGDMYFEVKEFIDLLERGERESKVNSHRNSLLVMELMDEIRRQIGLVYPADTLTCVEEPAEVG